MVIIEEVKTLLLNRKLSLNIQKASAIQSGDIERLSDLEIELQQVENLINALGEVT